MPDCKSIEAIIRTATVPKVINKACPEFKNASEDADLMAALPEFYTQLQELYVHDEHTQHATKEMDYFIYFLDQILILKVFQYSQSAKRFLKSDN